MHCSMECQQSGESLYMCIMHRGTNYIVNADLGSHVNCVAIGNKVKDGVSCVCMCVRKSVKCVCVRVCVYVCVCVFVHA